MRFLSWLDVLNPISSRRHTKLGQPESPRRTPARCNLCVETLEDRSLPSFLAPVGFAAGPDPYNSPYAVVTTDFNGDSRLDLAVVNSTDSSVSVLLGNADGAFQPARISATGTYPNSALAVGDFNADGKLDL